MKGKILAALLVYIYIYTIATPAWALSDSTSFNPEQVQVQAASIGVPVGTVIVWTKEEIPEGWLECNGQPVPDMYPDLKVLMPNVPNYQGMFLRGSGSQVVTHGSYGSVVHGTTLGEIQGDTIRNIEGTITEQPPYSYEGSTYTAGAFKYRYSGVFHWVKDGMGGAYRGYYDLDTSLVVPTSEENRPVNIGVKYLIKAE